MGGCRCTYKNCTVKSDGKTHMFHYPVFEKVRCHQWLLNAHRLKFLDLKVSQLKNRVVCQHHFKDECFMNFKKDKLTFDAIPTEDGPYCDSTKYVNVNPESSKLFSFIIEDIENDYNDKKANYSLKYGDFLANLDLMDIEKIDEDNISYKNTCNNNIDILTPHKERDTSTVFSEDGSFLYNISLHDKGDKKYVKPPIVAISPYMSGTGVNNVKSCLKTRSIDKHTSGVSKQNAAVTKVTNLIPKEQQQVKVKQQQIQHEQQQQQKEKQQQLQHNTEHHLQQERLQQQQLQLQQEQPQQRLQQEQQQQRLQCLERQQQERLRQQQQKKVRQQQQEHLRQQQQEQLRQQQQEQLRQQQQEQMRQQQQEIMRQQQQEIMRQQQQELMRQQQQELMRQQQQELMRQQQQEQMIQQQQEQLMPKQKEQQPQQPQYLQQQQQLQHQQLQKKETKVKILSEKKVTDPVAITGKFELVKPNYVLNVSKRRDTSRNMHDNNSRPTENKENGPEEKSIEIEIIPLSTEDDQKPGQSITSEKLPHDIPSENSPKVSVIKSRVPPERVEAINKKREFNMKLRDMVETCLDKLDNYNQTELNETPRTTRTKVNKRNNQQVKSLPKHTPILNPQEYTIAFLEARIRKMENTLLEKIEQNSMKIIDLKNSFGKSSSVQLLEQSRADEETHKKQLFLEISKYLSPSSKSLIYEELFINKFALNESTTSPKRKRRRRK